MKSTKHLSKIDQNGTKRAQKQPKSHQKSILGSFWIFLKNEIKFLISSDLVEIFNSLIENLLFIKDFNETLV